MGHMKRIAGLGLLVGACLTGQGAEGWLTDWKQAQTAAENGKDILIDFTGSDWCGWCIRLHKEVFSEEAFATYAAEALVLMEVDFPRKTELAPELKAQNEALRDQFQVQGYPTIYLADGLGRPFARTGYQEGGAQEYVDHLRKLHTIRVERDAAFALAAAAEGLEKAKHLAAGLKPIDVTLLPFYQDVTATIQANDPDGVSGFKEKLTEWELSKLETSLRLLVRQKKQDEAIAKIDAFIAEKKPAGELLQKALFTKLVAFPGNTAEGLVNADALMDEIIAIDAETMTAKQCTGIKERIVVLKQQLDTK